MENKTTQEKLDALIKEDGAEVVIAAIKGHVHPDGPGSCPGIPCPPHYYCSGGNCILDIGE